MPSYPVQSSVLMQHADMINDKPRNEWFERRITESCKDKIVMDVGHGTGILTYYAIKAGAKHVFAVETNSKSAEKAHSILSKCVDISKVTFINECFWTNEIESIVDKNSIDVIISETLGGAGIDEGILTSYYCAKNFLKPNGVFIPGQVEIDLVHWDTHGFLGDTLDQIELLNAGNLPKEFLNAVLESELECIDLTHWKEVANLRKTGQLLKTLRYSLHDLPVFRFNLEFPNMIFPEIEFTCYLPKGLLGFLPKMEGEYLYNFHHKGWRRAPFYYIHKEGEYSITYKKLGDFGGYHSIETQWVIQRVP